MELNTNQLNKNRKYFFNQSFFKHIHSETEAYWLGFIVADGSVRLDKLRGDLRITVNSTDRDHLEKFAKEIGYIGNLYDHPNEESSTINLYSKTLSKDLVELGVIPNKTGHESIPYMKNVLLPHAIRGVFDGDGTIGCYNDSWAMAITSGSENLLTYIKNVVRNVLGIRQGSVNEYPERHAYRLKFEGNILAPKIGNFLYRDANIYLDRKYKKYIEMVNHGIR